MKCDRKISAHGENLDPNDVLCDGTGRVVTEWEVVRDICGDYIRAKFDHGIILFGLCGHYNTHSHTHSANDLFNMTQQKLKTGGGTNKLGMPKDFVENEAFDEINRPKHYNSSPATCDNCGEKLQPKMITRHMVFNLGAVIKYLWRHEHKEQLIKDLKKAAWYLQDEIEKLEKENK